MFQKTVSFKFCLIHVHVKRLGVKFPWDLHWGYKTHKLNRSILSTLVKNHCINEQGRLAQCNQVTVTFAGHGEKVEATSLELKTLREGCYQNEERGTGNGERGTGKWKLGKKKPNLNPSPISNFTSNSLVCSHFFLSHSPHSFSSPFSPFKQHPSGSVHELSFNTWRR